MPGTPVQFNNAFHHDPKFGRLLLVSLLVHGLVWLAFTGGWLGSGTRPKPPVYYVDLIHKPVMNPQAGRPEPRPVSKPQPEPVKSAAASAPPAATKEPVKPAVTTPAKPPEALVPKPQVKPPAEPVAKPAAKPAVQPEPRQAQQVQSAINEIRARQNRAAERDALKDKLASLRESVGAVATVPADVPVGMPDGQGTEVGISALAFVQAFIQQNWVLSPYLIDQARLRDIEARATLVYAASGKLVRFRINAPSGNQQFDESLTRAIAKSEQLPQPLPRELELVVTFNLKEIAAARR